MSIMAKEFIKIVPTFVLIGVFFALTSVILTNWFNVELNIPIMSAMVGSCCGILVVIFMGKKK